jgi:hypothetical protein
VDEIGRLVDKEVDVGLEAAGVLADHHRRLDELAQLPVGLHRDPRLSSGLFVPEEASFVAGAADLEGVVEGVVTRRAGSIIRSKSAPTALRAWRTLATSCLTSGSPRVDLHRRVADLAALERKLPNASGDERPSGWRSP